MVENAGRKEREDREQEEGEGKKKQKEKNMQWERQLWRMGKRRQMP